MALMVMTLLIAGCGPVKDGQYAKLAQCLTDKGVKFYGAYWCPHCVEQKKIFGDDVRYVPYVECYPGNSKTISKECVDAGVKSYPTWFFPGQGNATGVMQPEELAKMANCQDALKADAQTSTPVTTSSSESSTEKEKSSTVPSGSSATKEEKPTT